MGHCKTASCAAFEEPIICTPNPAFGEFRPNDDQEEDRIICPGCKKSFEVEIFYFYKCHVKVTFKKEGG